MREVTKKRLVKLMKEVKFSPFPGCGQKDVRVECQLPEHAFENIAEHLAKNGVVAMGHLLTIEIESTAQIVAFNRNHVDWMEAIQIAQSGEYNPNVLVIPKEQWISLFRNGLPLGF